MTACPHCGTDLPRGANFCNSCGESVETSCPDCGESVLMDANFCPNCRTDLRAGATEQQGTLSDGHLRLQPREFARRLEGPDLNAGGFLGLFEKKQVLVEAGNEALLLDNGTLAGRLRPGKHTLESLSDRIRQLGKSRDLTVVLVEQTDTAITVRLEDIRTASDYPVTAVVELVVSVSDPEVFFTNLMADRNTVTSETFQRVLGDSIRDELEATLVEYERDELYGNRDLKRTVRGDLERHCRSMLERNGLELVDIRSFDYEDDRDHIREDRKQVDIREEEEDIEDEKAQLDRRERERETDDTVHDEKQRVRRETTEQAADHEIETQEIEHEHERDDKKRRHQHKAEYEEVEHEQEKRTTRTEGHVQRRDLEHSQDVEEMEDLMDLKKRKDMDGLDVDEREQDIEMRREEHDVEVEKERLEARDDVDLDTVASLEGTDEDVTELAEMEKAKDLDAEQLDSLGARESDELAKARQEANEAAKERQRVEDQKEFREEIRDMAEGSMDRVQETTESAMDNMGETGKAAAEDTSDNVIVSDPGSSDSGDTTIVQGNGGDDSGGTAGGTASGSQGDQPNRQPVCPECDGEVAPDDGFCLNCGHDL